MTKIIASVTLACFVSAFAGVASADELPATPCEPSAAMPDVAPPKVEWYGYQTLIADGAAAGGLALTMAVASSSRSSGPATAMLVGTLGSYALAAPIVHVANGEVSRGLASLGVRLAAPSIGAWVGLIAANNCDPKNEPFNFCELTGLVAGFGVGMLVASAIDASALAWKQAPAKSAKASIAPDISITPKGATVGATGRF